MFRRFPPFWPLTRFDARQAPACVPGPESRPYPEELFFLSNLASKISTKMLLY